MSKDENKAGGKSPTPVEMLVDGSFEQANVAAGTWGHQAVVGGWRSDTEIEVWGKSFYGLKATNGDKFAELDYDRRASNIYQDVATEEGTEYTFAFDFMKRPDSKAGSDTINVFWNGVLVGTVDPQKSEWSRAEFKVTGTGGKDRIEFREAAEDNDSYGGLIDNASLKRSGPTLAEREEAAREAEAARLAAEQAQVEDNKGNSDPNNDDLKHDGRGHGDGDHNDDGHTDNGQGGNAGGNGNGGNGQSAGGGNANGGGSGSGEQHAGNGGAGGGQSAQGEDEDEYEDEDGHESHAGDGNGGNPGDGGEQHADGGNGGAGGNGNSNPNNDDLKHDGRGHGDGDHNGDGHTDNGQGGNAGGNGNGGNGGNGGEQHADGGNGGNGGAGGGNSTGSGPGDGGGNGRGHDVLSLATKDMRDVVTGEKLNGDKHDNGIHGGAGNDEVYGRDGNDELHGDGDALVTVPLDIKVGLVDDDASETLKIVVSNMPKDAFLSAGHDNGDGSWTLTAEELSGLTLTGPDAGTFTLHVVASTSGASNLTETADINVSLLGGQDDLIAGNKGNDTLFGDDGDDRMYGGSVPTGNFNPHAPTYADDDVMHGGRGNDQMWGNSGDDQMFGEEGDDVLYGGKGNDLMEGGVGNDALNGNTGDDRIAGGEGNDVVRGNAGNDTLSDGDGNDTVEGNSGDDLVLAGQGDDSYNGGSGYDTIDFSGASQGMAIDLSKKSAVGMGHDTLSNFEVVVGSTFDDVMKGSKAGETLAGGDGNDVLRGLGGADVLKGGAGNDTFVFMTKDVWDGKHLGVDHVADFQAGDRLDLREMLKGDASKLAVTDGQDGTTVSVSIAGKMVDVAVLDGVHNLVADEMLKAGMILA